MGSQLALKISQLYKKYQNGKVALKGIDLEVKQGDFFALLGPNGAGKSTTIGIITDLINPTSGDVEIFGHSIRNQKKTAKALIGVVPQEFNFNQWETVNEIIVNQAGYYGIPRKEATLKVNRLLDLLELTDKREIIGRRLSGGMKRRLMIARALIHDPQLLILDEPTAGVDIEIRRQTWDLMRHINDEGTTIILTTHYLEEAEEMCNNIAIIDDGKITYDGSMADLLRKLKSESFVLNVRDKLAPLTDSQGLRFKIRDDYTLEAEIHKPHTLNELFKVLIENNIVVESMRNKSNRLEELFIRMTNPDSHSY